MNDQRIYEEYTILWFKFGLFGLQQPQDATDPTLNIDTGSEKTFQKQKQIRDDSTGQ